MGKSCNKIVHVTACISVFFALASGALYLILRGMRSNVLLNLAEYHELKREWESVPFVSLLTISGADNCPWTHPVLVAFDEWPGLNVACSCTSDAENSSVYGAPCTDARADDAKCKTLEAIPTLYLGVLDGYKICGKRGGVAFKSAIRP